MALLAGMVKNVLVIIIVASFLEILLPEGRVKPFVRFAIGLFIIIAVLNPVLNALFERKDWEVNLWDYHLAPEQEREVLERGSRINRQLADTSESSFAAKIEGQISAVAMLVPGVKKVETRAMLDSEGALKQLHLIVRPEENAGLSGEGGGVKAFSKEGEHSPAIDQKQMEDKIRSVINNLYGFKNIQIEIKFEGG
ncbi:stage III sporulation protein AF [Syntrophomonas curvata]